jgi:hypothetical protein
VQLPEVSVHVDDWLKLPVAVPITEKVTNPPVTGPDEPLSVAVTVMPVVEPPGAFTALTVAVVGATPAPTIKLTWLDSMPPQVRV